MLFSSVNFEHSMDPNSTQDKLKSGTTHTINGTGSQDGLIVPTLRLPELSCDLLIARLHARSNAKKSR